LTTIEKTINVESYEDSKEREQYENRIAQATSELLERDKENKIWFYHKYGNQWEPKWIK